MKKLILNSASFAGAEILSRSQLKKVMGGRGSSGECDGECTIDDDCPDSKKCTSSVTEGCSTANPPKYCL